MVVTLCGSARFERHFKRWNEVLTLCCHVVFSLAVYPSDRGGKDWYTAEQKEALDIAHKLKISASSAVAFLNVGGYMGSSTLSELRWAQVQDKQIFMLESWGKGVNDSPVDTTRYKYICDLLGQGGYFRSSLIKYLEQEGCV